MKLFIECKYSAKDKPWVFVVTSDNFGKQAFFSRTTWNGKHPSNWKTIDSLQGRLTAGMIQQIDRGSDRDGLLITNPGYVVVEALSEQGDHAYEGIVQISKCIEAHDNEAEEICEKTVQDWEAFDFQTSRSLPGLVFSIACPVVVINGQLFECYLTENNAVETSEIESGTAFVPCRHRKTDPHTGKILSPVSVVTEKHLDNYAVSVRKAFESLLVQDDF